MEELERRSRDWRAIWTIWNSKKGAKVLGVETKWENNQHKELKRRRVLFALFLLPEEGGYCCVTM